MVKKNINSQHPLHAEQFRAILENISEAVLLIDAEGQVIYRSPAVSKITGIEDKDAICHSVFDFIYKEDLPVAKSFLRESMVSPGVLLTTTLRLRKKHGGFCWVEGTIRNLCDQPLVGAFVINYRDISERKTTEEQIWKSKSNLDTILQNTTIGYALLDPEVKVISFNEQARVMYKNTLKADLNTGDYVLNYLPEERKPLVMENFKKCLAGNKCDYEISFEQADGLSWFQIEILPVFGADAKVMGMVLSSCNITERKNSENVKEKLTDHVMRQNQNLEQFSYIVSHNLRSPIVNIMALSDLLKSPDLSPKDIEQCVEGLSSS
jgi:PAS domain S-box-containing protein